MGCGWKVGLSAISLPDVDVNLTRFKEMTKPLLSASWLLIPFHQFKRRRKHRIGFNEFDVPGHPLCHHNIVDGLSFMKALDFKLEQVKNFKRSKVYLTETNLKKNHRIHLSIRLHPGPLAVAWTCKS